MLTTMRYGDRGLTVAIVLTASENQIRVVLPGGRDTMELSLVGGNWRTEQGIAVEIEAVCPEFAESSELSISSTA